MALRTPYSEKTGARTVFSSLIVYCAFKISTSLSSTVYHTRGYPASRFCGNVHHAQGEHGIRVLRTRRHRGQRSATWANHLYAGSEAAAPGKLPSYYCWNICEENPPTSLICIEASALCFVIIDFFVPVLFKIYQSSFSRPLLCTYSMNPKIIFALR